MAIDSKNEDLYRGVLFYRVRRRRHFFSKSFLTPCLAAPPRAPIPAAFITGASAPRPKAPPLCLLLMGRRRLAGMMS